MSEPFDSMVADVFATLGTAAVFTPAAGSEVSLNVSLEVEHFADPGGYQAQVAGTVTEIEYLIADIGRWLSLGKLSRLAQLPTRSSRKLRTTASRLR